MLELSYQNYIFNTLSKAAVSEVGGYGPPTDRTVYPPTVTVILPPPGKIRNHCNITFVRQQANLCFVLLRLLRCKANCFRV